MAKKKRNKAFWNNIKFKYKLTIINENTLEEVAGIRVSKLNGLSVLLTVITVIFVIAATIIAFTPLRNYLPGYTIDQIVGVLHQKDFYINGKMTRNRLLLTD